MAYFPLGGLCDPDESSGGKGCADETQRDSLFHISFPPYWPWLPSYSRFGAAHYISIKMYHVRYFRALPTGADAFLFVFIAVLGSAHLRFRGVVLLAFWIAQRCLPSRWAWLYGLCVAEDGTIRHMAGGGHVALLIGVEKL